MRSVHALTGVVMTVAATTAFTAVPTSSDPGKRVRCNVDDLKQAIAQANAAGGGTLHLARDCTYTLTAPDNDDNGLPVITTRITIEGSGSTIRRSTHPGTPEFRIFQISGPTGALTLQQITLRGGRVPQTTSGISGRGGGIWLTTDGTKLALDKVTITENFASQQGGGIDNDGGDLTIRDSTISHNHARFSGGIDQDSGTATIVGSRINENTATSNIGGIFDFGGTMNFDHSQVTNNTAGGDGGGIYADHTKTTLKDTIVSGNRALGVNGLGGGIYNTDGSALTVRGSKVFANGAVGPSGRGGGIANDQGSTATLRNSSVTDNIAYAPPGAIFNNGGTVTPVPQLHRPFQEPELFGVSVP
ncbi:right-handed parallel beta-helix repeat-containing protein, partial [Streptomyces sp. NPDC051133]|uniref:right-handed parallel beta-helix repeat-containing protein n=1 Tax=Streptomyces sp. NPDC051133 TaxID=3155521 RepID=UPI003429E69A